MRYMEIYLRRIDEGWYAALGWNGSTGYGRSRAWWGALWIAARNRSGAMTKPEASTEKGGEMDAKKYWPSYDKPGMAKSPLEGLTPTAYVLHSDYAKLEAESLEQARLLGMSAEREIALRAKADRMADTLKVISEGTQGGLGEGWAPTLEAIVAQRALADYRGEGKP